MNLARAFIGKMNGYLSSGKVWTRAIRCLAVALLGWSLALPAAAASKGTPIRPGEIECRYPLPTHRIWADQENWAWTERICLGGIANMSEYGRDDGRPCDPTDTDEWPDTRDLSSEFLETVLNHEPYRGALTHDGVRIRCAHFKERVDLSHMVLAHPIWLNASRFRRTVDLANLRTSSLISVYGSSFDGTFRADNLEVASDLFLSRRAQFKQVRLVDAKVGGALSTICSTFDGRFEAEGLQVAGGLFMRDGASPKDVSLIGVEIGGHLQLLGSKFKGHLNLTSTSIGAELHLTSPRPFGEQKWEDENYLPPWWAKDARLTLRNTHAGALNDTAEARDIQRGNLDIVGFTYDRLGGLRANRESALSARSDEWLLGWLKKQDEFEITYNPQPFEQLAKVLRESGYSGKADAILFEERNHQRDSLETPLIIRKRSVWPTLRVPNL